jgi:hypothetical protein
MHGTWKQPGGLDLDDREGRSSGWPWPPAWLPRDQYRLRVLLTRRPQGVLRPSWRSIDASQIRRQAPTKPHPDSPSRQDHLIFRGTPFRVSSSGATAKRPLCLRQDATSAPGLLACLFCWRTWNTGSLDSLINKQPASVSFVCSAVMMQLVPRSSWAEMVSSIHLPFPRHDSFQGT